MSHHRDTVAIHNAESDTFINCGFRAGHELCDVGVIRFGLSFSNDGDGGVLEDRVARRDERHRGAPIQKRKLIRRAADLPRGRLGFVFRGVRFQQRGKRAVLWLVTGRQVEIGAELDAVRAFVFQDLLFGERSWAIGIGEKCDLLPRVFGKIAHVIVGAQLRRFAAD